jgi:hypothetical protein
VTTNVTYYSSGRDCMINRRQQLGGSAALVVAAWRQHGCDGSSATAGSFAAAASNSAATVEAWRQRGRGGCSLGAALPQQLQEQRIGGSGSSVSGSGGDGNWLGLRQRQWLCGGNSDSNGGSHNNQLKGGGDGGSRSVGQWAGWVLPTRPLLNLAF